MVSLAERRRCVTYLRNEYEISERRACQAMQMNRSSYRYVGGQEPVDEKYRRVVSLSQQYPYWGYRKIYDSLRGQGICRERVRLIRRRGGVAGGAKAPQTQAVGHDHAVGEACLLSEPRMELRFCV